MAFNDEDYDGGGPHKNDGFDFEAVNRASEKVKFYNRIIKIIIFITIAAGAGCGIYLYNYISSGINNSIENNNKIFSAKNLRHEVSSRNGLPLDNSGSVYRESSGAAGAVNAGTDEIGSSKTNRASGNEIAGPENEAAVKLQTDGIALKKGKNLNMHIIREEKKTFDVVITPVSTNNKKPSDTDIAAASTPADDTSGVAVSAAVPDVSSEIAVSGQDVKSEHLPADIDSGSASVAVQTPVSRPEYKIDFSVIEKKLNIGNYLEFESMANQILNSGDISHDDFCRLNVLYAKYAFFIKHDQALSRKYISRVKKIIKEAASDYILLYAYLSSGASDKSRLLKMIAYVMQRSDYVISDDYKMELAKALIVNGHYGEAASMMNRIVAASMFEDDIKYVNGKIKKFNDSIDYVSALKVYETVDYSIGPLNTVSNSLISTVKILKTPVFKYNKGLPSACLLNEFSGVNVLYIYGKDGGVNEINIQSPPRQRGKYNLFSSESNFDVCGVFDIYKKRHAAVFKNNDRYQLAPVNNDAALSDYLPFYFKDRDLDGNFIISSNGAYAAKFNNIHKNGAAPETELEIVNLKDGKSIFKSPGVFFRENDTQFACFSAEIVKYAIDEVMECRYLYYFKNIHDADTSETAISLKLYLYDMDKKEERPLLTIEADNSSDLYISRLDYLDGFVLSYRAKETKESSAKLKSGTWLIGRQGPENVLRLSGGLMSCFAGSKRSGIRLFYAYDFSRESFFLYEITSSDPLEYIKHAESLFKYYPDYSLEKLDMLKNAAALIKLSPANLKILDSAASRLRSEAALSKAADTMMLLNTLIRVNLKALLIKRADDYIKNADSLTDEDGVKILELKKEAEILIKNDK